MMKWAYVKATPWRVVLGAFVLAACGDSSNVVPAEPHSFADVSNDERRVESDAADASNAEHSSEDGAGDAPVAVDDGNATVLSDAAEDVVLDFSTDAAFDRAFDAPSDAPSAPVEAIHYYGRWNRLAASAITVNSGSHVTATFHGTAIAAKFDTGPNQTTPPNTTSPTLDEI